METKTKNTYKAPVTTVTEVKTEGVICLSTLKTLWIGTDTTVASPFYGLQDYGVQAGQDW